VTNYGDRESVVPGYTLIDLGARYRMRFGKAPATMRVQALNITDEFAWTVFNSNSYVLTDGRRYTAMLFVDF
jgi:iron complex outermembrane recepter protein